MMNCRLRDEMARRGDRADMLWGDLVGAVRTSELCGDLVIKILAMLPVKSILRFRSVCKAWYALLNSPAFIRHHCDIVASSAAVTYMLSLLVHIDRFSSIERDHEVFSLLLEHSCGNRIMKHFNFPFEGKVGRIKVVGSINGLVCLTPCMQFSSFVLWNPATRKQSHIRNPQLEVEHNEYVCGGFAYDQKSDSYKIVRILCLKGSHRTVSPVAKVEIYSTETDTWRTSEIADFPCLPTNSCGVVVSGLPYWFFPKVDIGFEKLIWFDASTEAFKFYTLPPDDYSEVYYMRLEVMGKHPILMDCKYDVPSDSDYDSDSEEFYVTSAYIRKLTKSDDGGKDSFHIEKLTVEPDSYLAGIVGFGRNGEIVAEDLDYNTLLLCDQDEIKHLASYEEGFAKVYYYNESLVWPSSRLA